MALLDDVGVASDWVARALVQSGYAADFSPQSLREIDRCFSEQSKNGAPRKRGLLGSDFGKRMFALGCYVGEVIRRAVGGTWAAEDSDPQGEIDIAVKLVGGTVIWPVQRVATRLRNGNEDSIAAYGVLLGVPHPGDQPR